MEVIVSGLSDELSPSGACGVDDRVVVSKTVFESQFWRRYCQTFSTGFSSGAREGRKIGVMLSGTSSLLVVFVVCHPARSSSSTAWAPAATLREISSRWELHHVSVGVGQREGRTNAAGRADRAKQIGVVVALVGGLARACPAPGPLPNLAVLLANPGPHPELVEGRLQNQISTGVISGGRRDEPSARAGSFMEWPAPPSGVVGSPANQ